MDLGDLIYQCLGPLTLREQRVVELRFGLKDENIETLEEIGEEFQLTRERIRQIESKALKRLSHSTNRGLLLNALLAYVAANKGSLLVGSGSALRVSFLAERLSIPITQFPLTSLLLLGHAPFSLEDVKLIRSKLPDMEAFGTNIFGNLNIVVSKQDWARITADLKQPLLPRVKKSEKVYLALKQIGKASHYEKIYEMYCELFREKGQQYIAFMLSSQEKRMG